MIDFSLPFAKRSLESEDRRADIAGFAWHLGLCVLMALGLRAATFGNPNLFVDEAFYFAAGIDMAHGALPYVDIWDRKPFGHFALYALIAAISRDPIAYQITAAFFAGYTAFVIWEMARDHAGARAGCLAAILYLFALPMFGGYGGQSPVFYNALVASCAWIVFRQSQRPDRPGAAWSLILAMGLGGLALTIKQTVVFEISALGLWAAWKSYSCTGNLKSTLRTMAIWIAVGAAPTLAIAAYYWLSGHWSEFWQAMVLSNLSKSYDANSAVFGGTIMAKLVSPLAIMAIVALRQAPPSDMKRFILIWLGAAALGVLSVPNLHLHYALPMLVPLALASTPVLARPIAGSVGLVAVMTISFAIHSPLDFARTERTISAMERLAQTIRAHDGGRPILIFDGPPMLYHMSGHRSPTALAFPPHLSHGAENNVSHLDTEAELRRVLAQRPGVIVDVPSFRHKPPNARTAELIETYTSRYCRVVGSQLVSDRTVDFVVRIHGDCAP